jgi:hypothetical protein
MIEIISHEIGKFYFIWIDELTNDDADIKLSHLLKISGTKINKNKQIKTVMYVFRNKNP